MINFNRPPLYGTELSYLAQVLENRKLSGDGPFTQKCHLWMQENLPCSKLLLTTSCTHALEMAAILCDIQPGDEVIMPSYTFVSTANAFVLRGAKIVFVDIRPDTMNIDETLIEQAITPKTKVIVPVHYAGVACDMDRIMKIAAQYNLLVVEDAAQGFFSKYKGENLGTIGHLGCFSFHETKNISCGEGGALAVNDDRLIERAEIIREKGTNRTKFFRGQVDKYTWVDIGSSYLPSELNAAYLYAQLEAIDAIYQDRMNSWNEYQKRLSVLVQDKRVETPVIPAECGHNAHMFYIKVKNLEERTSFIKALSEKGVMSVFHYIPLHSAPGAVNVSRFSGNDRYTTRESERLVRLPLYYSMDSEDLNKIIETIIEFFR
ncbi:degt/dnrj/eryc1/strs aminotransferase [Lucifera butyrica]|uniref:Degt/dnrj/eryc1/strs aminotransferase n=1 Tax=Lucifera butyrica TaxID=1351585 RepID=A0A498R2C2_9FIRM|nr:dTDP-4-amino-4,6-dideoxygalactose transaminase [Lucifera butyrica]VBB05541.1 degt/dnrj/eryc1/strs aminotransferase [Lucifera butyrica]